MREFRVYRKILREAAIGGHFVTVKWVDLNKGDTTRPEYRSRLVARELKKWDPLMSGTFAATPPLECLKLVLSNYMTEPVERFRDLRLRVKDFEVLGAQSDDDRVILILDVSRAHFHPEMKRKVFIELPLEDRTEGKDEVGELLRTMYGCRDASAEWESYYSDAFENADAKAGSFSPCLFVQEATGVKAWVHGDDMALEGKRKAARELEEKLKERMLIKRRAELGWSSGDDRKITLLNSCLLYTSDAADE